ncbi:MAG: hypothetical protein HFJ33_02895 [Clostridia bacterium]|nr:hypothetical protein [Clostridia bacterium]
MKLQKGQVLYINNQKYTVKNIIEFSKSPWIWQEYEIAGENDSHKWFVIEEYEDGQVKYFLYENDIGMVDMKKIQGDRLKGNCVHITQEIETTKQTV